ncbi:hypothetical protein EV356DRAFT_455981 [Viridothelium virens]|uniref:Uncharacterized protein n=1 Tax=Viridothelium virens TaxID=1048519 RepID=A0A6A6GV37_VIRVR|nr:hypothetical protein EV356DRAFT_455981 [Viridothelium virens]
MSDASKSHTPFSKRPIKSNPLVESREVARNRRRDVYLKQVQDRRNDKSWAARGDQILQLDYVSERKKWEAEMAQSAPPPEEPPEEEADLPVYSSQGPFFMSQTTPQNSQPSCDDAREIDDIERQQQEDLEALLSLMETEEEQGQARQAQDSQRYGSDDEDYDSIFLGLMNDGEQKAEAMDTSNG